MPDRISFSFGENWQKYLEGMPPGAGERMAGYVRDWIGSDLAGTRIVDIGSGQGLTSLCAFEAGAHVTSFDIDGHSVAATRELWRRAGSPDRWSVRTGSILDEGFIAGLGVFDVVISWGVLHHTGDMWRAVANGASLVAPEGRLWIALYHKTRWSGLSRTIKRAYNWTPNLVKPAFRGVYAAGKLGRHFMRYRNFDRIHQYQSERGMSWRRDIEDWLGGLPYEVADPLDVKAALHDFRLERIAYARGEGGNDVYLFSRIEAANTTGPVTGTAGESGAN